jgi:hypothetical protein
LQELFPEIFNKERIDAEKFNLTFRSDKNPKILYHYTSINTLKNILYKSDGKDFFILRGTDIGYLNDVTEYSSAQEIMFDILKEYEETLPEDENKHLSDKLGENFFRRLATNFGLTTTPFITSFSEHRDSLPMWSMYGRNGDGVAIGCQKITLENPLFGNWGICTYNAEFFKKKMSKTFDDLYKRIEISPNGKLKYTGGLINDLGVYFSILKDKAYEYEQEWRLVMSRSKNDKEIHFQNSDKLLKPYIENEFPKSAMKEIIIGPCTDKELSRNSIGGLLRRTGYSTDSTKDNFVNVRKSEVPYRKI